MPDRSESNSFFLFFPKRELLSSFLSENFDAFSRGRGKEASAFPSSVEGAERRRGVARFPCGPGPWTPVCEGGGSRATCPVMWALGPIDLAHAESSVA